MVAAKGAAGVAAAGVIVTGLAGRGVAAAEAGRRIPEYGRAGGVALRRPDGLCGWRGVVCTGGAALSQGS